MERLRGRKLTNKLRLLGIYVVGLWGSVSLLGIRTCPEVSRLVPSVSRSYQSGFIWTCLFLIAVILSVWILVILKDLIFVQQGKKTERNFRLLLIFVILHVIYVLGEGGGGKYFPDLERWQYGDLLSQNVFFPFVLLFAFINGFRCKWIHYLNKNQKAGFFFFFALVYPLAWLLLIRSGSTIRDYSVVIGSFTKSLFYIYVVYSSMSLIGILSLLPSAGLMDRKIREIKSLQALSATIGSVFNPEDLIAKTVELAPKVVGADFSWLELKEKDEYRLAGAHGIKIEAVDRMPDDVRNAIRLWDEKIEGALLVNDLYKNKRTGGIKHWGRKAGSLLAARIVFQNKELGIIYAMKREPFGFVEESRALFQTFADQVAVALDNAHLVQVTIDQEIYREELRLAHEAQMRLLPQKMPEIEGVEIDAFCATANEIGGDFYDLIPVGKDRLDIVVGDVSGKGASAAFYMAELKGVTQALAPHFSSPKKILLEVNDFLQNHFEQDTFVTMVYAIYLPSKKQMRLVRAGHPPVGLVKKKKVSWIETSGVGLGLAPDDVFGRSLQEKVINLKKGDTVFFYTDGLSEARNSQGDEYGEDVLTETLLDLHNQGSKELLQAIRERLDTFTQDVPRHDDVTIVAMRILK
jgi:serine phosphatase RsbU (regulator of sigma subunit)